MNQSSIDCSSTSDDRKQSKNNLTQAVLHPGMCRRHEHSTMTMTAPCSSDSKTRSLSPPTVVRHFALFLSLPRLLLLALKRNSSVSLFLLLSLSHRLTTTLRLWLGHSHRPSHGRRHRPASARYRPLMNIRQRFLWYQLARSYRQPIT